MNKVVTINLGGNAYQLEEAAYDALRAYLSVAEQKLATNPDKDEIVKDLEQAIGVKCSAYINMGKTVVTLADVEAVLAEMGPVDGETQGESEVGAGDAASQESPSPKRLYRIPQGEWISGVCSGLAVYFNVDVSLVRILFVLLTVLTHGLGVLVYIVMMIVVPVARTPKEYEYATGVPPVTAQELVDRARKGIEDFANSNEWKSWKDSISASITASHDAHRTWKQQKKAWKRAHKEEWKAQMRGFYKQPKSFLSELSEFIWSMFGLLVVSFFIWFVYHHVPLVAQFLDALKALWNQAFYTVYQFVSKARS